MSTNESIAKTAVVTGASRGLDERSSGPSTTEASGSSESPATASSSTPLGSELRDRFTGVAGDASDPELAARLVHEFSPEILVLNAGAAPTARPLQEQTWETFSQNWNVDTRHVFNWTKEALLTPLIPGSVVISLSSGAAIGGSPLSGGYDGAKAAIRYTSQYAASESDRGALGIRFTALLPQSRR